MTMNPQDKYISPRPAPPVPSSQHVRVGTAPAKSLKHKRSSRSPSPSDNPSWSVKRLFRMRSRERGREDSNSDNTADTVLQADDNSSIRSGSRSRDISPEALRIFLSNDIPTPIASHEARPTVTIPEEIVEEAEDDDNFASSAASENVPFSTVLSPPPFRRTQSSSSTASTAVPEVSTETVESRSESVKPGELTPILTSGSTFNKQNLATSYFSVSPFGDELHLPMTSLHTPNNTSFFNDSSDDEDDDPEGLIPDSEFDQAALQQTKAFFSTYYSLPYTGDGDRLKTANKMTLPPSPALIDGNVSIRDSGLLTAPTESGFNEVVSELGWMSNYI